MHNAPVNLSDYDSLHSYVRRAYHDLRTLEGILCQSITVADRDYVLKRHGNPIRPDENWLRPVNARLYIESSQEYAQTALSALRFLQRLRLAGPDPNDRARLLGDSSVTSGPVGATALDRFLYTTVQAPGCLFDVQTRTPQRQFGLLYQNFIHCMIRYLGFQTASMNIQVPLGRWHISDNEEPCVQTSFQLVETDMVIGAERGQPVRTTQYSVWPEDSFATIKSSTKDRISQVFIDGVNIQRLSVWRIAKYVLFVHNDVQRAGASGISWTFLPSNFRSGSSTFPLSGIYFSDMPGNVIGAKLAGEEWARLCRNLSDFVTHDLWV